MNKTTMLLNYYEMLFQSEKIMNEISYLQRKVKSKTTFYLYFLIQIILAITSYNFLFS